MPVDAIATLDLMTPEPWPIWLAVIVEDNGSRLGCVPVEFAYTRREILGTVTEIQVANCDPAADVVNLLGSRLSPKKHFQREPAGAGAHQGLSAVGFAGGHPS
jgi:hypothetical protein